MMTLATSAEAEEIYYWLGSLALTLFITIMVTVIFIAVGATIQWLWGALRSKPKDIDDPDEVPG